ncbi:hypothetical protein [Glutamicibacter ardleyensis]|uniref:hypothetical protein n=1 Tax=Glutamicibacter ardleyensis TaxID=225894 RepID=UPI003FD58038
MVSSSRKPPTEVVTPPRHTAGGWHADDTFSFNPLHDLGLSSRLDPYWEQIWAPGSQAVWSTKDILDIPRVSPVYKKFHKSAEDALEQFFSGKFFDQKLSFLGVLDSWRTITAQQASAFTGMPEFADANSSSLSSMFLSGLIDIGAFNDPIARLDKTLRSVYRPTDSPVFRKQVEPRLTFPEWLHITGGTPWHAGGQYDRHNVLSTELALRCAEYLEIGAVLGEKYASVDLLAGTGLGKLVDKPDNRRADGVIVRKDGLRIAFELTANDGADFERKVRRWAELISERPLETSGLVVVYVTAGHPSRLNTSADPRVATHSTLLRVLKEFPGRGADSPAGRIGIVSWDEWFPARHELSDYFLNLSANFATGTGSGESQWETKSLMEFPFAPRQEFNATAITDQMKLLGQSPWWMREGDHTRLIGTPLGRENKTSPIPSYYRGYEPKYRQFGTATGRLEGYKITLPDRLKAQWKSRNSS